MLDTRAGDLQWERRAGEEARADRHCSDVSIDCHVRGDKRRGEGAAVMLEESCFDKGALETEKDVDDDDDNDGSGVDDLDVDEAMGEER